MRTRHSGRRSHWWGMEVGSFPGIILGIKGEAYAYSLAGELDLAEKDYAKAVEHYGAAVAVMAGDKDPYHLMWMRHGFGQALVAAGQKDRGLAAYREAIEIAKQLRIQFRSSEFRAGFFGDIQNIYDDAIGLLVDLKRHDESLALSEESRARALLDVLKEGLTPRTPARPIRSARFHQIPQWWFITYCMIAPLHGPCVRKGWPWL